MSRNPTAWVLLLILAFFIGLWLAIHGYAKVGVVVCLALGGVVQLTELHRQTLQADFDAALKDCALTHRDAASYMKLDPSDLGKMLRGDIRFDLWRFEMLPDEVRRCFYFRRAKRLGLPEFVRSALKMAPAFDMERSAS